MEQPKLITIEPCINQARLLAGQALLRPPCDDDMRFIQAFTALADDDQAVGLLAYYIWRRRVRRRT